MTKIRESLAAISDFLEEQALRVDFLCLFFRLLVTA